MLLSAIETLSRISGEDQLANAPLYLVGDSQGGQFSFHFAAWKPDRTLGFVSLKGGRHEATSVPGAAKVPGLFFLGQLDTPSRIENIVSTFTRGRLSGAPWCLAVDPGAKHEPSTCGPLVRVFLEELSKTSQPNVSPSSATPPDKALLRGLSYPDSWFPSPKFDRDWELFEAGDLPPATPKLSFRSKTSSPIARAAPSLINFGAIASGNIFEVRSVQVVSNSPLEWDNVKVLDRPFLSEVKAAEMTPQSSTVLFKLNTAGLPLGRFSGVLPLRFVHAGTDVCGALNVPITADVLGDVSANPSFISLGSIQPRSKTSISVRITSKAKEPITFVSSESPKDVESVSFSLPANPLRLTISFAFGEDTPSESVSGSILLHLETGTTKAWILRVPYIGSFADQSHVP